MTKLRTSKRAASVVASPIRKFLPLVLAAEKKGVKVFKVNVGDPDLPAPVSILRTIQKYNKKNLGYAPSPGLAEHVRAWLKYYQTFGIKLEPADIVPTVGGSEAILLAMLAVCDVGDELLVFEPLYTSYKGFATMANIKLAPVTLKIENNFSLPAESEIIKKITKKTKGIVVVNPNNPTGAVLNEAEIKTIIKVAERFNLFIIADETYREIIFQGRPRSFLQYPRARDRVIVADSVSKRFSCPGARIGCVVSYNAEVMSSILKFAMIRLSAPTLEQYGLIPLLENSRSYTKKIAREYQKRRTAVFSALRKIPGVICAEPQGAFYILAKLPIENSEDFIKWLLTKFNYQGKTILLTPASEFYITPGKGRNEVRIAYVLNIKELKEAMTVLRLGLAEYRKTLC